jgi:hypothetical protein
MQGRWQSFALIDAGRRRKQFNGAIFEQSFQNFEFELSPTRDLLVGLEGRHGDEVDFEHTRPGKVLRLEPFVRNIFARRFHVQLDHAYERLNVDGGRLYTANLSQLRLVYQFNLRTFVRAILQYTDIDRNTELYTFVVEPENRRLFTQLLFSYKVNPQTLVFVGYSDSQLGQTGVELTRTNRTLFVKLGYAWLM